MLPASGQVSKACAFCNYKTDDEALFAEHVSVAHGWGKPPRGSEPGDPGVAGFTNYCYGCATANPSGSTRCSSCNSILKLAPSGLLFAQAYVLNQLEVLLRAGLIDEATATRLRGHYRRALGKPGTEPAPLPAQPAADVAATLGARAAGAIDQPTRPLPPAVQPAPSVPAGPGFFSPERAPSLLLYVGAFLIVIAALIFVTVSGQQISGEVKLSLLILGTIGFLTVGLVCHRSPRVLEAGTTFLLIGALLVPLDFAAYQVLLSGQPLSGPTVWTLGSLIAAGLYAALAATGFGRLYAYLFLPAVLSAVAGLESVLALDNAWFFLPIALVPILITLVGVLGTDVRIQRITAPLDRPGNILATIALAMSAAVVPIFEPFGTSDRRVTLATFVVAAIYSALRARKGGSFDRWRATLGPLSVALAIVYLLHGQSQTYGFALALAAIAYASAVEAMRAGVLPVPGWLRDTCERVALGAAMAALLPAEAYWRAPFVGAAVDLMLAAAIAVVCLRRVGTWTPTLRYLLVASGILLHVGIALYLLGVGFVHAGTAPYTSFVGRELALAFAPLSALLAAAAWFSRGRLPQITRDLARMTLASIAATLFYAYGDPVLATILGSLAGAAAIAAARAIGVPRILWLGAASLAYALVGVDRWLSPPHEIRPIVLAFVALAVFIPAALPRWRAMRHAAVVREIALASAASGIVVGLSALGTPLRPASDLVWMATIVPVLAFGAIGLWDGLIRASEEQILGSSAFFLGAALMLVARAQPGQLEVYTVPVALYLTLVAWAMSHWKMVIRSSLRVPVRVAAAAALVLPTYALSWLDGDAARGTIVLAEGVGILIVATWLDDRELGWAGVAVLGAMLVRGIAAPLVFESASAAFGALTIALTLVADRIDRERARAAAVREPVELIASLLIVAPPLARAMARGADALDQGASALAIAVVLVALALMLTRRQILLVGMGAAAAVGLLALPESQRAEPYVSSAGAVLLALALAAGRLFPYSLPASHLQALEATAAALLVSSAAQRTFLQSGDAATRLAAEAVVLCAVGLYFTRPVVSYAGLASTALVAWWVLGDPAGREFHGTLIGAGLVLLSLGAARYRPLVLEQRARAAMEAGGALLFFGPTLLAGWREPFFPRTPMVFFEILLVLGAGVLLHRRWLIAGALGGLGLETVRALIDVVNRLPNYLLFAISGVLLLAIGFVLLLKREAWREWSQRVTLWWSRV